MNKVRVITSLTVLATLSATLAALAPTPHGQEPMAYHMQIIIPLMTAIPHLGAAIIIVLGLSSFTARLKRAYTLLVAGFVTLGAGFIQTAMLPLLGLMNSAWAKGPGIPLPFVISAFLGYLGIRNFSRLFGVKSIWNRIPVALLASIIISVLATLLPHGSLNRPEAQFDAQVAVTIFNNTLFIWGGILVYKIRKQTGHLYVSAMNWLLAGIIASASIMIPFLALLFTNPNGQAANSVFILQILTGFVLVKAAIEFYRINAPEQQVAAVQTGHKQTIVDAVIYVANLASNLASIDPVLDTVRGITASKPNGALSEADQVSLSKVYLQLEHHLTEEETVRKFTKEELRQNIHSKFAQTTNSSPVFWQKIDTAA